MTPHELKALQRETVTTVERAGNALGMKRTLSYQLARERGELVEGVRVLRVGRMLKVPTRPLLAVLGYEDTSGKSAACSECGTGEAE